MAMMAEITREPTRKENDTVSNGVAGGRLWCPAMLPNGTQGHWFFVDHGSPLLCIDPTCSSHGRLVHQCPVHRGFLGRLNTSSEAAIRGKEISTRAGVTVP